MDSKKEKHSRNELLQKNEQKSEYKSENQNNTSDEENEDDQDNVDQKKSLNNAKLKKKENVDATSINKNSKSTDNHEIIPNSKKHQRCVPLEIYKKVYQDKQILLNQVELLNKEISTLNNSSNGSKNKIDEILNLETKIKTIQREKANIENVLINQEKYVNKLKSQIETLKKNLYKKNEELMNKENIINEYVDKIEELKNKIMMMKENFKLSEKKEIMKLNDQIISLTNKIEIKQSKMDNIDKKYKNLQNKYLKLLGDKRKMAQENLFLSRQEKEINELEPILSNNSNFKKYTINTNNDSYKYFNHNSMSIKKSKSGGKDLEIKLPEIDKNSQKITLSPDIIKKNKESKNNRALKDINSLLEDYYNEENQDGNEDVEDEEEERESNDKDEE